MAVSVIVCIFCFVRWERKSSDLSFQFEETTYTYKDEYYDVDKLVYLQMVGSRDKEKERKINQLLEWNHLILILMMGGNIVFM